MELTCPKCHGTMRQYERNGVTIDQCAECRGIFLDRGELEHLMDAEKAFYAGAAAEPIAQPYPSSQPAYPGQEYPPGYAHPRRRTYGSPGSPDSPHWGGMGRRRKPRSFLSELFD